MEVPKPDVNSPISDVLIETPPELSPEAFKAPTPQPSAPLLIDLTNTPSGKSEASKDPECTVGRKAKISYTYERSNGWIKCR